MMRYVNENALRFGIQPVTSNAEDDFVIATNVRDEDYEKEYAELAKNDHKTIFYRMNGEIFEEVSEPIEGYTDESLVQEEDRQRLAYYLSLPQRLEKRKQQQKTIDGRERLSRLFDIVSAVASNLILAFLSFLVLFPLIFMILSSLRSENEYISRVAYIFPNNWFNYDNYKQIVVEHNFMVGYKNTFIVAIAVIPCGTFFVAMAAFSFAKLKLKHKQFWLLFLLSGMMIPGAVLLMPRYVFYETIGWIDTLLPLIVPHLLIHVGTMFFFIQYMKGIPSELFEAAKIDGCSTFRMFLQIMIPLLLPAIAAQDIFWFMGIWNDYFAPSIYLRTESNMTLQVLMQYINTNYSGSNHHTMVFAGAVMSCLPMVVVYLILQRFFIKSMSIGAVKG